MSEQDILGQGRGEEKYGFNKQLLHISLPLVCLTFSEVSTGMGDFSETICMAADHTGKLKF